MAITATDAGQHDDLIPIRSRPERKSISRALRRLAVGGLLLALLGGGAWRYTNQSDVVISVDGELISVRTRADSVASVLRERGVVVDAHDRVSPPLHAAVTDGTEITVRRAQRVTLELNGTLRSAWTTATTVAGVVDELGFQDARLVSPEPTEELEGAGTIVLRTASEVRVVVDGQERAFLTPAPTVADFLEAAGVAVDGDDEVLPARDAEVSDGLEITVRRVDQITTVEERSIPFDTERRDDPSLARGQVRTVQEGRSGLERIEYRLTERDGEVVDREVVSRTVVREPVTRVVAVGTKVSNRQTGKASWYSTTSMTCAHKTLPMGTRVTVVNLSNGRSVVCRVADRGPFVEGRIIDLAHDAFSQIADLSVGVVDVRITW